MSKFKSGDRVKHSCDETDVGTVVREIDKDYVKVIWDRDGLQANCADCLTVIKSCDDDKEQEAVILLLSLGYTVSKNKQ